MCKNRPTVTNTATKVERLPDVHLARVARSRQHPVLNVTPKLSHRLLRSVVLDSASHRNTRMKHATLDGRRTLPRDLFPTGYA